MKKTTKLFSLILVLGMMMGIFATFGITASAAPDTTTVDGTTYYEIGSAEDLVWFANEVNENDQNGWQKIQKSHSLRFSHFSRDPAHFGQF